MSILPMTVTEAITPLYNTYLEKHFWYLDELDNRLWSLCHTNRYPAAARLEAEAVSRAYRVAHYYMESSEIAPPVIIADDVTSRYNALERHHWSLAEAENKLSSYCGDMFIDFGRERADNVAERLGLPGMQRALVVAEYYAEHSRTVVDEGIHCDVCGIHYDHDSPCPQH